MERLRRYVRWQEFSGEPITVNDVMVTPESQALIVSLPFCGFVWNRPVAVHVEDATGSRRVPVPDVTRYVQWSLFAASALMAISMWLLNRKR